MLFSDLPSNVQEALTQYASTKKCSMCHRPRPSISHHSRPSGYSNPVIIFQCRGPRIKFTRPDGEEHFHGGCKHSWEEIPPTEIAAKLKLAHVEAMKQRRALTFA